MSGSETARKEAKGSGITRPPWWRSLASARAGGLARPRAGADPWAIGSRLRFREKARDSGVAGGPEIAVADLGTVGRENRADPGVQGVGLRISGRTANLLLRHQTEAN